MIRLIPAEVLRLRKRRAVWFLTVLMAALIVVVLAGYWFGTRPARMSRVSWNLGGDPF
jgi:hypothetical protein